VQFYKVKKSNDSDDKDDNDDEGDQDDNVVFVVVKKVAVKSFIETNTSQSKRLNYMPYTRNSYL